jgi:hypothetical protein
MSSLRFFSFNYLFTYICTIITQHNHPCKHQSSLYSLAFTILFRYTLLLSKILLVLLLLLLLLFVV